MTVRSNEVPGKDAPIQLGVFLAATDDVVFGTCVANMWVRRPKTAGAAASQLDEAYPGRFIFGLGIGVGDNPAESRAR